MKNEPTCACLRLECLIVMMLMILAASCGGGGGDNGVEEDRGEFSVMVKILGVQHCGYVTHSLDRADKCYTGDCKWDFSQAVSTVFEASDGYACDFVSWGGDCSFAGADKTCPLMVDKQYDCTATFRDR